MKSNNLLIFVLELIHKLKERNENVLCDINNEFNSILVLIDHDLNKVGKH